MHPLVKAGEGRGDFWQGRKVVTEYVRSSVEDPDPDRFESASFCLTRNRIAFNSKQLKKLIKYGTVEDRKSSSSLVVCTRDMECVKSAKVL